MYIFMYFTWDSFEYKMPGCRKRPPSPLLPAWKSGNSTFHSYLEYYRYLWYITHPHSLTHLETPLPYYSTFTPSIFRIPDHRHHSIFTWVILLHGGGGSLTSAPSDIGWSQVNGPSLCANIGLLGSFGVLTYAERSIGRAFPEILNSLC
jgi:hypothetical protein